MARLKRIENVFEDGRVDTSEEFIFLGSIADLVEAELGEGKWEVRLNGIALEEELWPQTFPTDTDLVVIQPSIAGGGQNGDEKSNVRMMALIGVSIASMGVGAMLGPTTMAVSTSVGMGTITTGSTMMAIAGMTATNIIGGMLVNKLLPYPEAEKAPTYSAYSIDPVATQQQGLPYPMWYGYFKLKAANAINAYKNDKVLTQNQLATFYDVVFSLGLGPWESITSITIPGALSSSSLETDYRLGYITQSEFDSNPSYSGATSHTVSLTGFTNSPKSAPTPNSVEITVEIPATEINKIQFDMIFPNGAYTLYEDTDKGYVAVGMEISIADSASFSGGDYAWQPVNSVNFTGKDIVPAGVVKEATRATRRWSYGQYAVIPAISDNVISGKYKTLEYLVQGVGTTRWVEYATSANAESAPPTIPAMISLYTWRYLSLTEPIVIAEYTEPVKKVYGARTSNTFEFPYEFAINPAVSVTSYILKLNLTSTQVQSGGWAMVVRGCSITTINSYGDMTKVDPLTYPRCVLAHVVATGDKNVSSLVPEIIFQGRKVAVWGGTTWAYAFNNNPAWVCYDVLSQPLMPDGAITPWTTTSPAIRYEGINPAQLDYVSFKAWADFCDTLVDISGGTEKRYTFNGGFDTISNLWEAALAIAGNSQAWLVWHGNEIQVVLDHTTATTQLFGAGDYVLDSVKESYLSLTDRATAVEVEFIDAGKNYESNKFSLTESGFSDSQKKVALTLRGCTNASQAYRSAKFELLKNKHLKKTISFQAPLNAITCTIGDVVEFQSCVLKAALGGGRIKSVTSPTILVLDRAYTFVNLTGYTLKVAKQDGTLITATLVNLSGTTSVITLTAGITVSALDSYAIGETDRVVEKVRVLDLTQSTDLLCTISGIQYIAEIYDYNDSDIPNIVYSPIADMPEVTIVSVTSSDFYNALGEYQKNIEVIITPPSSIYYKQAKCYFRTTTDSILGDWNFAGTFTGNYFSFPLPAELMTTNYEVIVATVNTDDITMNLLDAPSETLSVTVPDLIANPPTSVTPVTLS